MREDECNLLRKPENENPRVTQMPGPSYFGQGVADSSHDLVLLRLPGILLAHKSTIFLTLVKIGFQSHTTKTEKHIFRTAHFYLVPCCFSQGTHK